MRSKRVDRKVGRAKRAIELLVEQGRNVEAESVRSVCRALITATATCSQLWKDNDQLRRQLKGAGREAAAPGSWTADQWIKNCPCCGGQAEAMEPPRSRAPCVGCFECDMWLADNRSLSEAVAKWNRRPLEEALQRLIGS